MRSAPHSRFPLVNFVTRAIVSGAIRDLWSFFGDMLGIPMKSSTSSGVPRYPDAMPSEQVVGMVQNRWTASIGIDGRHGPDCAVSAAPLIILFFLVQRTFVEGISIAGIKG